MEPALSLTHEEKRRKLYLEQKKLLDTFLAHRTITRAQYDKSLGDLTEKMGMEPPSLSKKAQALAAPYRAKDLLLSDLALHADFFEALETDNCTVLCDTEDTFFARQRSIPFYMLTTHNAEHGKALADSVHEDYYELMVRNESVQLYLTQQPKLGCSRPCRQVLYREPIVLPASELVMRHPAEEDFEKVAASYHILSREELRAHFDSDSFYGGYVGDELVGYIGIHSDGPIGMLTVLPEYRRHGYGKQLLGKLAIRLRNAGHFPYAQVYSDNYPSLDLQRALGADFSREMTCWFWVKK